MLDPNIRLDPETQAEVDARIAQMKESLPRSTTVADLVPFAAALNPTADPNVKRILRAAQTLVAYQRLPDPGCWKNSSAQDAVTDAVVDFMHLCAIIGADFGTVLEGCRGHFAEESVNPWL